MPPRKRAAKKAAAKRTTPYDGPEFPLAAEGYLATTSVPRNATNRGIPVVMVRNALGLPPGPARFDDATRDAVMAFQTEHGLEVTGVVTRADWEAIHSATAAGGVDGADEADGSAG